MSYVHVFIAHEDKVYLLSMHYRSAMKLLEKGEYGILRLLRSRFLDAGYLVLDLNKKTVVNGQTAFSLGKTIGKKEFYVVEI